MKKKWKKVKTLQPFCSICNEQLRGDNSMVSPYRCKCGEWHNSFDDLFDYKLTPTTRGKGGKVCTN